MPPQSFRKGWSIRTKLTIVFLGFLLLVAGAVAATFLALERQAADTLIIRVAVHQRVYVQDIARAVVELQTDTLGDEYYLDLIELDRAAGQFDRALEAMLQGGTIVDEGRAEMVPISSTDDARVREQLTRIQALWQPVREAADVLAAGASGIERSRAVTEVSFRTPLLYAQIDALIQILETRATSSLSILKFIQIVFFLSAVGLLAAGYALVKRTLLRPLELLDFAAQRIASGDLGEAISLEQHDEVGALAHSFETMRQEVAAARRAAESWTVELESRVQRRTQELAALLEISTDISSKLDVDRVLNSVVEMGRELVGAEVAVLCLLDASARGLRVASFSGSSAAIVRSHARVDRGLAQDVIANGQTVTCDACGACPILAPSYLRAQIAAPLRAGETTIGALCVAYSEARSLSDDVARLLTLLANAAAIALENARLYARAQSAATLAERERIAAEMHDALAQTMGYLNLQLDLALCSVGEDPHAVREHLQQMRPAIQSAYGTVRRALVGLSDSSLAQRGFKAQLESCVQEFRQKCAAEVTLDLDDGSVKALPDEAQPQLLRIVQECLTNIQRHAAATCVQVRMERKDGTVAMTVMDDGAGFDPTQAPGDDQPHLGLAIMRGRVERVGGELIIQSKPGAGTRVLASVPADSERVIP